MDNNPNKVSGENKRKTDHEMSTNAPWAHTSTDQCEHNKRENRKMCKGKHIKKTKNVLGSEQDSMQSLHDKHFHESKSTLGRDWENKDIYLYALQTTDDSGTNQSKPDLEFIIYIPINSDVKWLAPEQVSKIITKELNSPTSKKPERNVEKKPAVPKMKKMVSSVKSRKQTGAVRKSQIPPDSDDEEDLETEKDLRTQSKRNVTFIDPK